MGYARPRCSARVSPGLHNYSIVELTCTSYFKTELGWDQGKVDDLLLPIIRKMSKRSQVRDAPVHRRNPICNGHSLRTRRPTRMGTLLGTSTFLWAQTPPARGVLVVQIPTPKRYAQRRGESHSRIARGRTCARRRCAGR